MKNKEVLRYIALNPLFQHRKCLSCKKGKLKYNRYNLLYCSVCGKDHYVDYKTRTIFVLDINKLEKQRKIEELNSF